MAVSLQVPLDVQAGVSTPKSSVCECNILKNMDSCHPLKTATGKFFPALILHLGPQ